MHHSLETITTLKSPSILPQVRDLWLHYKVGSTMEGKYMKREKREEGEGVGRREREGEITRKDRK